MNITKTITTLFLFLICASFAAHGMYNPQNNVSHHDIQNWTRDLVFGLNTSGGNPRLVKFTPAQCTVGVTQNYNHLRTTDDVIRFDNDFGTNFSGRNPIANPSRLSILLKRLTPNCIRQQQ